jgi:phytanoyl-CoA hydroxylase
MLKNRHNHASISPKYSDPPRLHRDVLQWSRSIVTVIVYLEETTLENGCTHIIPGSHYLPFVGTPNNGGTWMDEHSVYFDLLNQSLPVPMTSGGILFFDGLTFHGVGVNTTDNTRMSVTMAYHSVDELCKGDINSYQLLVRGDRIYKGNDL